MKSQVTLFAFLLFLLTSVSSAQWISIRTVPVIASHQSDFLPSFARGMGNASIALDDPLGDPFINPAKASRLEGVTLFLSPSRNSWSNEDGRSVNAGRGSSFFPGAALNSLPLGVLFHVGDYFGGAMFAYQGYKGERSQGDFWSVRPAVVGANDERVFRNDVGSNTYLFGLFGTSLFDSKLSIAGSFAWGKFGAIDGVNLLYPGATDIKQDGNAWQAKVGVVGELPDGDRLELVAGRGDSKTTHEVSYSLGPRIGGPDFLFTEINKDETREWLLHAAYVRPVSERWKIGAALSVNWKDHPKIPNYALANIPRDPGTSNAYNVGIGSTWTTGKSLRYFEYVFEPITSYTWAEAGEQQNIPPNLRLAPNFKTVENYFDFANHILRIGHHAQSKAEWLDYRFGVQFHFFNYTLNQHDNLARRTRRAEYDWIETTASGGVTARFGKVQLLYTLQLIFGNGMVGVVSRPIMFASGGDLIRSNDILPAPSGELVVDTITLVTQQLTFVYSLH